MSKESKAFSEGYQRFWNVELAGYGENWNYSKLVAPYPAGSKEAKAWYNGHHSAWYKFNYGS